MNFYRTWSEWNLGAWEQNLYSMAMLVGGELHRVIPVIKAGAYGHGVELLPFSLLEKLHGVAVAQPAEAQNLRKRGFGGKIYLLSSALAEEAPFVLASAAIPLISTVAEAAFWAETARKSGLQHFPINLELDTGMGRSGLLRGEQTEMVNFLKNTPALCLDSLSSHLASADEDAAYTATQDSRFRERLAEFAQMGLTPSYVHLANSAGAIALPQGAEWRIRCGISLYGWSPVSQSPVSLLPALEWHSRVLLVRQLPAGWGVSYGRTHVCAEPTRVASIGVGYADGYPRALSGKGAHVLIAGTRCPVLGRVTMDQLMADVTHLPEAAVRAGTQVTLIGQQGAECITAAELATLADTIPYEIFTGLGPRVVRTAV
jgi:alanine racemase